MQTSKIFMLGLLLLVALPVQGRSESIKIGVALCLSGDCAEWGTNGLNGARLAAKEINQKGGVLGKQIELVVQDTKDTSPAATVAAFQKLLRETDLHYIVGPTWTVGGMAAAPILAEKKDLVVISPSVGVRDFNETSSNLLNIWPHDEIATRKLAQYAWSKGWKKAAIFGSEDPWVRTQSDTFEEEFKKLGGSISKRVEPLPSSRELKAEALQIKASQPDVVFFSNYQTDVFAGELRALNFSAPQLAILMEKERVQAAAGALEGAVFALYEAPAEDFQNAFREMFGSDPGISADTSYDALKLFGAALQVVGDKDPEKVREQLLSVEDFKGASGTFSINDMGAVDKKPVLWRVKGLEYEKLQ